MKEEFTYGELVEVRDDDDQEWEKRVCVGTLPHTNFYWCMQPWEDETNYSGWPVVCTYMRKIQPAEEHNEKMKEEFTYGELVEVRNHDWQVWQKRCVLWVLPDRKGYWCMRQGQGQDITNYTGQPLKWNQIRKIQPHPQPEHKAPEQDTMAYLQEQIEGLSKRVDKIESELKNSLK